MRRSSKKLPKDPNQLAAEIVRLSTEDLTTQVGKLAVPLSISQYLSKIGKKGGLKGGKARAKKLTAKKRSQIARQAARARWEPKK